MELLQRTAMVARTLEPLPCAVLGLVPRAQGSVPATVDCHPPLVLHGTRAPAARWVLGTSPRTTPLGWEGRAGYGAGWSGGSASYGFFFSDGAFGAGCAGAAGWAGAFWAVA